jgi:hypothetical protein
LIALYKALGGGWYAAQPLVDHATRKQMETRTDWDGQLDESAATQPAFPQPDKVNNHE